MTNLAPGAKLTSRYQIISQLGQGGFGTTFLAEDQYLPGHQKCVVKQLKPQETDSFTLETARRLFDSEAQTLYQLGTHPQIPQLFAYFEENQEFYLVQEYIEGDELALEVEALAQDERSGNREKKVIALLQEILEILTFVHQRHVIHRDVNPRNLIRRQHDGKLVLIDFGAVKQVTTQIATAGQTKLTVAIGTPGYRPSEQAQGYPKLSSDIYAVGMIGIEALTGCPPHQLQTDSNAEISWQPVGRVSPGLVNVLNTMVRYDFRQRYPSAIEALQALKELSTSTVATVAVPRTKMVTQTRRSRRARRSQSASWFTKGIMALGAIAFGVAVFVGVNYWLSENNATTLYRQGKTLYQLKRYEEAQSAYQKALSIRPNYTEAWVGQGNALQQLQRYEEALAAYEKAIQIDPEDWQAWVGRAQVFERLGRDQEAIDAFNNAVELQPNAWEAWSGLGTVQMKQKQYEGAVTSFEQLLRLRQDDASAWYERGWALHQLGQYEEAVKSYDKALDLKPYNAQAWYQRGNALIKLNQYKQAAQAYQKAVESQPDFYQAWYSRGVALSQLKQYEAASAAYDGAVKAQPDSAQAWYQRGWVLHQAERYRDAVASYDRALELKSDPQTWYNRGNALYSLGDYEEAVTSYSQAVESKPDYFQAWISLGNALLQLKQYQNAIAAYTQALQYQPDSQPAQAGLAQAQQVLERTQEQQPREVRSPRFWERLQQRNTEDEVEEREKDKKSDS